MTTGQRIKEARKNAGMTQKELGEKLGVSFQGIAQWENDLRKPKLESLQKIATALDVPIAYLLGSMNDEGAIDLGLTALELSKRIHVGPSIIAEAIEAVNPDYPISPQAFQDIKRTSLQLLMKKRMVESQDCASRNEKEPTRKGLDLGKLLVDNFVENEILSDIDLTAERIKYSLSKLNREGRTIIIVTHDEKVASYCGKKVYMLDGKLGEDIGKNG